MSFKCKIGLHTWNGCKCSECGKIRDEQHVWQDCSCSECGKIRDERHVWEDCKCLKCGKNRNIQHNCDDDCEKCSKCGQEFPNNHEWDGCICSECGKTRDKQHDYKKDCEKCSKCGKVSTKNHNWIGCKCYKCGKIRNEQHDWSLDCQKCSICGCNNESRHNWQKSGDTFSCSICSKNVSSSEMFWIAIEEGELKTFIEILAKGFDLKTCDSYGRSALHIASLFDQIDIVKYIISKSLNINAKDNFKDTPLHFANSRSLCEILLLNGAEINAKGYMRNTPLHLASNNIEVIKLLISHGANINATNDQNEIPLHIAVLKGTLETIEYLLKAGSIINFKKKIDHENLTPLYVGILSKKDINIVKSLLDHGANPFYEEKSLRYMLHHESFKDYYSLLTEYREKNISNLQRWIQEDIKELFYPYMQLIVTNRQENNNRISQESLEELLAFLENKEQVEKKAEFAIYHLENIIREVAIMYGLDFHDQTLIYFQKSKIQEFFIAGCIVLSEYVGCVLEVSFEIVKKTKLFEPLDYMIDFDVTQIIEKSNVKGNGLNPSLMLPSNHGCLVIRFSEYQEREKGIEVLLNLTKGKRIEKRYSDGYGINYKKRGFASGNYAIVIECNYCNDTWHSQEYEYLKANKIKFCDIDFIEEYREIVEVTKSESMPQ